MLKTARPTPSILLWFACFCRRCFPMKKNICNNSYDLVLFAHHFLCKKAWFWIPVRMGCSPIGVFDSLTHSYSCGVPPWTRGLSYTVGDQPSAIFWMEGSQVSMVPDCLLGSWPALAINGENHMMACHWLVIYDLKLTYRPRYVYMVFAGPITTMTKFANVVRPLMFLMDPSCYLLCIHHIITRC